MINKMYSMTPDQLQNELLNLSHHLEDVEKAVKGLKDGQDSKVALALIDSGLGDMKEGIQRMAALLPNNLGAEVERMTPGESKPTPEEIAALLDDLDIRR